MQTLKKRCVIIIISLLILSLTSVVFAQDNWWRANNYKEIVYIWNNNPTSGEQVHWEGGVIDNYTIGESSDITYYYVHGYGKATWYLNGNFEQSDEGNHYIGKRHGEIIQHFADGRVVKSYWEYGKRIR